MYSYNNPLGECILFTVASVTRALER